MSGLERPGNKSRYKSGTRGSRWLAKDIQSQRGHCQRLDIGMRGCSSDCPAGRCRNGFEKN